MSSALPDLKTVLGDLDSVSETGRIPERRLRSARDAWTIFDECRRADSESAYNRKLVDEMYDGEPPYDPAELKSLGQAQRYNLNFGEAAARLEADLVAYNDLTSSVPVLGIPRMTTGSPEERSEKEMIMAEEFTAVLKGWSQFEFNQQLLYNKFIRHGVGVIYRDHPVDWRWQVTGLDNFKVPRMTPACEDLVEIAFSAKPYALHKVYNFIRDEGVARKMGWNPDALKRVMLRARYGKGKKESLWTAENWERLQEEMKNNDLGVSCGSAAHATEVWLAHVFVPEFNGKVSHYIIDAEGEETEWIFQNFARYDCATRCFTFFTYGVGNGSLHSIRGQGYKIFDHIKASNRLRNTLLDAATMEGSLLLDVQDAEDSSAMAFISFGPFMYKPPGVKVAETQFSGKTRELLPVINDLSLQIQNNTGTYRARAVEPSGQERTKFEVQAQLAHESALSTQAMNLFYVPWGKHLTETFIRMANPQYARHHPGFKEVAEFRKRCFARGVTLEDLRSVRCVEPVRAVGYGSPQRRLLAFDRLTQIMGAFDEVGRSHLLRDLTAESLGSYQGVDRYVPKLPIPGGRPTQETKLAQLENSDLRQGVPVMVLPGENHLIHAREHLAPLMQLYQALDAQQVDPVAALTWLEAALPHLSQHLGNLAGDVSRVSEFHEMKAALQRLAAKGEELRANVIQAREAEMRAMQEQQAQQAASGAGMSPEFAARMEKLRAEIISMQEKSRAAMALSAAQKQQELAFADLHHAQTLRHKEELMNLERASQQRQQ